MDTSVPNKVKVPIVYLNPEFKNLGYSRPGDAGIDLRANEQTLLKANSWASISCGIKIAIPEGFGGFVLPRSGLAAKRGVTVLNSPGLIDSGYRGEVKVVLTNTNNDSDFQIDVGDRIAQLVVLQTPFIDFEECFELDVTNRGEHGFGSTGI